MFTSGPF